MARRLGRMVAGMVAAAMVVLAWPDPAGAAMTCHTVAGQRLCLESIKRSAKYFWQYRAVVSVDGQPQPEAVYNCQAPPLKSAAVEASKPINAKASEVSAQDFVCQTVPARR